MTPLSRQPTTNNSDSITVDRIMRTYKENRGWPHDSGQISPPEIRYQLQNAIMNASEHHVMMVVVRVATLLT